MKITVHAVGRMKAGPERELADRYFERFARSGPAVGLEYAGLVEIAEGRAQTANERRREEGQKLQTMLQQGTALILLDERGRSFSSEEFAGRLGLLRDSGRKALVIAIGGADGHDQSLRDQADLVVSFGALTWPHQLVRVMLGEQLYRAATILAGHPYHRS
ncbi:MULTISPECIES: 23S rRNA (pseudouridine(1915)-N(3))-methyltransferase RlmH [unclassified Mesorhizobium]|uniref:23S rRNA (pseudouridine(1915)-N(3))-methyltransferase RlmH n=1 Tax=Mesorhizobium TaxID=68287 RepID=UPI000FCAD0C5|nr:MULTISPECIES: 23S rRNA (pseudouridine(1915)-N(3))-methyltransferase RlmH [unclassified Mesorhizobium]RUW28430.1 23S rRNA (pseudouridine(1915)-N(3))-methyltransferase RlmH [Mesorhizobium sp. M4B.F.Ca.ET.013.02.1.1]RUW72636.1 23S rRNA (pseudouridine(1915)-N(3))-methyltransferase RlmH [Mesorhizobium sp. M4B.F.Ca.ET.049.02.1.2]RVD23728.1 23S rRNA (pseudouridine(1915)-N(3))-methyltransferase RlmH [Mesorhizobium sp. M4B.F.Ca.ET.017.02.2.1]RVD33828.1 23S rRNA (pseudouridine(1915)-N(3))-methyltransf